MRVRQDVKCPYSINIGRNRLYSSNWPFIGSAGGASVFLAMCRESCRTYPQDKDESKEALVKICFEFEVFRLVELLLVALLLLDLNVVIRCIVNLLGIPMLDGLFY